MRVYPARRTQGFVVAVAVVDNMRWMETEYQNSTLQFEHKRNTDLKKRNCSNLQKQKNKNSLKTHERKIHTLDQNYLLTRCVQRVWIQQKTPNDKSTSSSDWWCGCCCFFYTSVCYRRIVHTLNWKPPNLSVCGPRDWLTFKAFGVCVCVWGIGFWSIYICFMK